MNYHLRQFAITIILIVAAIYLKSCANIVAPMGGPKDTTAPQLINQYPRQYSKTVKTKFIELEFSEEVKLNNLQQQLIITPSITSTYKSEVRKNKVKLDFDKPFNENTTYTFLFREAIKDITEGNSADNPTIVFSTGEELDSLKFQVHVTNHYDLSNVNGAYVALYELTDTFKLGITKPTYLVKTGENGKTLFQNLPANKYKLLAFEDLNKDGNYSPNADLMGFITDTIETQSINGELDVTLSVKNFSSNKVLAIESAPKGNTITPIRGLLKYRTLKPIGKQPYLYIEGKEIHTLEKDTLPYKIQIQGTDSVGFWLDTLLDIKRAKPLKAYPFVYSFNTSPAENIIPNRPIIIEIKDSLKQIGEVLIKPDSARSTKEFYLKPVQSKLNKTHYYLDIPKELSGVKSIVTIIRPKTFINWFDSTNTKGDTTTWRWAKEDNYGIIRGTISTRFNQPIVQLTDPNGRVIEQQQPLNGKFMFNFLKPREYRIRVLEDINKDGLANPAFWPNIQAEPIHYFKEKVMLKANWEIDEVDFR